MNSPSHRSLSVACALAVLILATSCKPQPAGVDGAPPSAPPSANAAGSAIPAVATPEFSGSIDGFRLQPASRIPTAPARRDGDGSADCGNSFDPPKSAEARTVGDGGWTVFREAVLQGYTVVGAAESASILAGAGCRLPGGRLFFFRDGHVVAVAEGVAGADGSSDGIQLLQSGDGQSDTIDGDRLRFGGMFSAEGMIVASPAGLHMGALPAFDDVCGGRARVPRIERLAYAEARSKLLADGWRPATMDNEVTGWPESLREAGITEVEDCAGTGLGQCNMRLTRSDSAIVLDVGTVGDDEILRAADGSFSGGPSVQSASAQCATHEAAESPAG